MASFRVDLGELVALRQRLQGIRDRYVAAADGFQGELDRSGLPGTQVCGGVGSFPAAGELHQRYGRAQAGWNSTIQELDSVLDGIDQRLRGGLSGYEGADRGAADDQQRIANSQHPGVGTRWAR